MSRCNASREPVVGRDPDPRRQPVQGLRRVRVEQRGKVVDLLLDVAQGPVEDRQQPVGEVGAGGLRAVHRGQEAAQADPRELHDRLVQPRGRRAGAREPQSQPQVATGRPPHQPVPGLRVERGRRQPCLPGLLRQPCDLGRRERHLRGERVDADRAAGGQVTLEDHPVPDALVDQAVQRPDQEGARVLVDVARPHGRGDRVAVQVEPAVRRRHAQHPDLHPAVGRHVVRRRAEQVGDVRRSRVDRGERAVDDPEGAVGSGDEQRPVVRDGDELRGPDPGGVAAVAAGPAEVVDHPVQRVGHVDPVAPVHRDPGRRPRHRRLPRAPQHQLRVCSSTSTRCRAGSHTNRCPAANAIPPAAPGRHGTSSNVHVHRSSRSSPRSGSFSHTSPASVTATLAGVHRPPKLPGRLGQQPHRRGQRRQLQRRRTVTVGQRPAEPAAEPQVERVVGWLAQLREQRIRSSRTHRQLRVGDRHVVCARRTPARRASAARRGTRALDPVDRDHQPVDGRDARARRTPAGTCARTTIVPPNGQPSPSSPPVSGWK